MAGNNNEKEAWVTFFWNIENYSYFGEKEYGIQSPEFKVVPMQKISWRLRLYPCRNKDECFFSYYLCAADVHGSEISTIEYDITILAEGGSVLQINERERLCLKAKNNWCSKLLLLRKDVIRENFLPGDMLRFRCRLWWTDGKVVTPVTLFARTALKVEKRNFLWNIAIFGSLRSHYKFPYVIRSESNDYFMIFKIATIEEKKIIICSKSLNKNLIVLKFQSFITDTNGRRIDCGKWKMTLDENEEKVICMLPFSKQYILENKEIYLKNDVLTLYCECSWSNGNDIDRIERIDYGISSPYIANQLIPKPCTFNAFVEEMDKMVDLKEDFESLYSKSILSDVKLRTTTQTFNVHKNILSARSTVFGAMFKTDMKEKIQESVDISDLEDDTVRRMLLYMYTNALEDLQWDSALKLYAAADKYEILTLKSKCSLFLKCNLCSNNVCDVLILADMHSDGDLKKAVQDYALAHEKGVFHTDEWILFTKINPVLASETMLLKWNNL